MLFFFYHVLQLERSLQKGCTVPLACSLLMWTARSELPIDLTLSADFYHLVRINSLKGLTANVERTLFFFTSVQVTLEEFQLVSHGTSEKNCGREHSNTGWSKQQ